MKKAIPNAANMKRMYIAKLADFLASNGKYMSGQALAQHLNQNKITADNGKPFVEGTRGIYTLIGATYHWLERQGLEVERKKLPKAFIDKSGEFPWDK
jgi:hypothetical protein